MAIWNPWHGCKKYSPGCANCYVYRRDSRFDRDASRVAKTSSFSLPLQKNRQGAYRLTAQDNPIYTCMTSDFFLEEADPWRPDAWKMIRQRQDLEFIIITKRIHRFSVGLPEDWGEGYPNVTIACTCENQQTADNRLPIFLSLPIQHREIIHEPMLEAIQIQSYLSAGKIQQVTCGGESGEHARPCEYQWILSTRKQCVDCGVAFSFHQTGAVFVKDGRTYQIPRSLQHSQAKKAGLDYQPPHLPNTSKEREELFQRLAKSEFRSRFSLSPKLRQYVLEKGEDTLRRHARELIRLRLAPAHPKNDGKQTPMKGHPVFLAQHATACCCRGCLEKWYGIPQGRPLTEPEQNAIVEILLEWIQRKMGQPSFSPQTGKLHLQNENSGMQNDGTVL